MKASIKEKERILEREIRQLANILTTRKIGVRREQLSRGRSYRVKSGDCVLAGANVVFVDKRLPLEQQVSVLVDYLVDLQLQLGEEELACLAGTTQELLRGRLSTGLVADGRPAERNAPTEASTEIFGA